MSDSRHLRLSRGPQLELARIADAASIAHLSRDHIETGLGWAWTPARVLSQVRDPETVVLVARDGEGDGERLAAFAIMRFNDADAHLNLLAVGPAYRRRGIGRRLVEWLESSASVAGIGAIHLEVRAANRVARAFYGALGYRETGRLSGYYRGVETAVKMVHTLWVLPPGTASRQRG